MKNVVLRVLVSFVAAVAMASNAFAYTITFDDLETPGSFTDFIHSYNSGSYLLDSADSVFIIAQQSSNFYQGSAALWTYVSGSSARLQKSDSTTFSLESIDLIRHYDVTGQISTLAEVTFNAYDSGNNLLGSQTVGSIGTAWQTVTFGDVFDNVALVTWSQDWPYHDFDNIVLGSPTPIPGAIWLLGTGLAGLVGLKRRKRAS
ncbi:VPLPA-CTERM sorting domain-containing protein [Pseudodesulfovibrio portus]|uniref:Secreted protein n=1 Tax=Pseudodesulfovibrio portus TaxID=231439 RepID=A0ABM8AN86_9BACT|nr:VPLPA-CTERM sorting domain-containing protein [Pseudodesulfovibrio portus]BDQ32841.1 hypothetical protein JCM14722_03830 [Pseudodesulfovibrio portus]